MGKSNTQITPMLGQRRWAQGAGRRGGGVQDASLNRAVRFGSAEEMTVEQNLEKEERVSQVPATRQAEGQPAVETARKRGSGQ